MALTTAQENDGLFIPKDSSGVLTSIVSRAGPHLAAEWSETTTADNAAATVTRAAEVDKSHYITAIAGSFSAAAIQAMTLKDGATVMSTFYVHNAERVVFAKPVKITAGAAAELSLAASGTSGTLGAAVMFGYTV